MASETLESTYLCQSCKDIFSFDRQFTLSELQDAGYNCQLCKLLYDCLQSQYNSTEETFHIKRSGSFLINTSDAERILGILSYPCLQTRSVAQVGVPDIYSPESNYPYFELLRHWLQDCDKHGDCTKKLAMPPTRVLDVGGENLNILKLVKPTSPVEYIALSHCWGNPSEEDKKRYSTTNDNYTTRLSGFLFDDLPETFQDAIRVTRELGKKYLWIDSLCIIQGDYNDWETEAERMQHVFASAYCTLAASSATGWDKGFLKQRSGHHSILVGHARSRQIFVSDNVDNFENDVEKAPLNQRGWVVQERALSRRIIHFTGKRTYWECGEGVRCENFLKMNCPSGRHYFLIDPRFPHRLTTSGYYRSIDFIQFLFQKYAKCALTKISDREIAIKSLMQHMSTAFNTKYRHGTFNVFLHRLLLWHRSDKEIVENVRNYHEHYEDQLPSWSWMTYAGIAFPSIRLLKIADIRYNDNRRDELLVQFRKFQNCKVKQEKSQYWILNGKSEEIGQVWFDKTESHLRHCVVVGMEDGTEADADKTYWVLVIKKGESRFKNGFKRVGIGKIKALYVSKEGYDGQLM